MSRFVFRCEDVNHHISTDHRPYRCCFMYHGYHCCFHQEEMVSPPDVAFTFPIFLHRNLNTCSGLAPNSFNFMQFLDKFCKIVCWRPPGSWRPLLGEILDPPLTCCLKMSRQLEPPANQIFFNVIRFLKNLAKYSLPTRGRNYEPLPGSPILVKTCS